MSDTLITEAKSIYEAWNWDMLEAEMESGYDRGAFRDLVNMYIKIVDQLDSNSQLIDQQAEEIQRLCAGDEMYVNKIMKLMEANKLMEERMKGYELQALKNINLAEDWEERTIQAEKEYTDERATHNLHVTELIQAEKERDEWVRQCLEKSSLAMEGVVSRVEERVRQAEKERDQYRKEAMNERDLTQDIVSEREEALKEIEFWKSESATQAQQYLDESKILEIAVKALEHYTDDAIYCGNCDQMSYGDQGEMARKTLAEIKNLFTKGGNTP